MIKKGTSYAALNSHQRWVSIGNKTSRNLFVSLSIQWFLNMRKGMFLPTLIIMSFCCNSQKQAFIDAKISNGYYYGIDKLFTIVFAKVAGDTVLIDFILFEKYPRELLTDTLLYNSSNHMFLGKTTNILLKNGRNYTCTNQESMVFGKKIEIKLNPDESYYKKHFNEYKNYAVWYQCYKEYLKNNDNKDEARRYFQEQGEKKNIKSMIDTYFHKDFLKELGKFKSELKSFK